MSNVQISLQDKKTDAFCRKWDQRKKEKKEDAHNIVGLL